MFKQTKPFLKYQVNKKKALFLVLIVLIIGLSVPYWPANAAVFTIPGAVMRTFAKTIIALYTQFILLLANVALTLSSLLLEWVTSPNFVSLSYTNAGISSTSTDPAYNHIVGIGWGLMRDLANMGFVLALTVIGLATALRIREYDAKKALPLLIGMALLVNFSPVICGVMIDASNIVMSFFLEDLIGWDAFINVFKLQLSTVLDVVVFEVSSFEFLARSLCLIAFAFTAAAILAIYSFLFIARYIALWVLVILSPLAFVAYAIPQTRKFWTQWWSQMLNWTIVGAASAFFLYLSLHMLALVHGPGLVSLEESGYAGNILNQILPYGTIIVFLYMGFFTSLKSSATGATEIINFAKGKSEAGKKARGFVGRQAGSLFASGKGKEWMTKAARVDSGLLEKGSGKRWKAASVKGKVGMVGSTAFGWAIRKGAKAGLGFGAQQTGNISQKEKEFEGQFEKDDEVLAATYGSLGLTDWQGKVAMGQRLMKIKGGKSLGKLKENQLREIVTLTAKRAPHLLKDLVAARPELIRGQVGKDPDVVDGKIRELIKTTMVSKGEDDDDVKELIEAGEDKADVVLKAVYKKVVEGLKQADIENLGKSITDDPIFREMMGRYGKWSSIRRLAEEKGTKVTDAMQDGIEEKPMGIIQIAESNPGFARAPYTAGGALLRGWEGYETKKDMDKLIRQMHQPVSSLNEELEKLQNQLDTAEDMEKEEQIRLARETKELEKIIKYKRDKEKVVAKKRGGKRKQEKKETKPPRGRRIT